MKATSLCTPTTWNEKPYDEITSTVRMTKASVQFAYTGELEGVAHTEYVMFYEHYDDKDPHAATASYVGLTRFSGKLNGKSGSFVTEDRGTFIGGTATTTVTILAGSGTDELRGIQGRGDARATQRGAELELEYDLT